VRFPKNEPPAPPAPFSDRDLGLPRSELAGLGRPTTPLSRPLILNPRADDPAPPTLHAAASTDHLYELGLTNAAMGFLAAALDVLLECVARAPGHAGAWRKLAQLLRLAGRTAEARSAEAAAERASLAEAAAAPAAIDRLPGRLDKAERKLRDMLRGKTGERAMAVLRDGLTANPLDVVAMRLLAQRELQAGDTRTAWSLLQRILDLCPAYIGAREDYAASLLENRAQMAVAAAHTRRLLDQAPRHANYRRMHALALALTGKPAAAAGLLAGLLREQPRETRDWLSYGQVLHALGRRTDSEQAFRKCLALQPGMGEAYAALADLKGDCLKEADVDAIRAHLQADTLDPVGRMHMLYALAHAKEQAGDFSASFTAYEESARLSRAIAAKKHKGYKPRHVANRVRRQKAVFTRENLEKRLSPAAAGRSGPTPIFIVGMPRAGSSLVEQILASHSLVEGTGELPLVTDLTYELAYSRILVKPDAYPECLLDLTSDQLAALGARVVERAADYRQADRAFFVDKDPINWLEAGLIHLILPHAKIIDIRREPMAACFAMFKQKLSTEAMFSTDLVELGRYYNSYVSMMDHWETVLPGRIHFMRYERLVDDTEHEIRRLLDYCGLPFEDGCLRFWQNDRAVATPSSEQVRRPIFRSALQHWRNFEPWLGPLREALEQPPEA
jgi:tetratricopeptide (TPR) repeat protein